MRARLLIRLFPQRYVALFAPPTPLCLPSSFLLIILDDSYHLLIHDRLVTPEIAPQLACHLVLYG